jgi:hypothetical protein
MLLIVGFDVKWIEWVVEFFSIASFFILINGVLKKLCFLGKVNKRCVHFSHQSKRIFEKRYFFLQDLKFD